jgi:hypothetical protein
VEGVPAPPAADEAIVLESVPGSPGIVLAADEAMSPAVREGMVVDEGASPAARGSALGEMPGGPKKAKRSIKGVKRSLQTALGDEPVFAEPPALLLSPRAEAVAEGKGAGKAQAQVHQLVRTFSMYEPPALVHDAVDPALLFARSPKRSRHDCDIKALSPLNDCDIKALSPLKKVSLTFQDLQMFDKDPV